MGISGPCLTVAIKGIGKHLQRLCDCSVSFLSRTRQENKQVERGRGVGVGGWEFTHSKTTFSPSTIQTLSQYHVYCYKLSPSTIQTQPKHQVHSYEHSRIHRYKHIQIHSYKLSPNSNQTQPKHQVYSYTLSSITKFTVTISARAPSLQLQTKPQCHVYSYKLSHKAKHSKT